VKQITFLVGSFHPDFSAVGYCAYQVQKCLTDEFDVSVISLRGSLSEPLKERLDTISVHRIETDDMRARAQAVADTNPLARARLMALRLKGAARRLLSPQTIDQPLVRAYLAHLEEMDPRPKVIVPVVFPFETVLAALAFKRANPETIVIPYLFDDFVDSGSLHVLKLARALKRGRHLRLERRMLEVADAVLSMHPLRAHFERYFSSRLREKITYLEHPLLTQPATALAQPTDDAVTRLCYTGALLKKVREPDYLRALLRAIRPGQTVQADFYVMGSASAEILTESVGDTVRIVNHGRVPKPEADAAVQYADILINLGDAQGKQVSSKVFEYMGTGKPIVHLAYVPDDTVTRILSKYPLALCLVQDQGRFDDNVRLFSEFITTRRGDKLNFETVKAIYPEALPEASAMVFSRILIGVK
jgi:hypothetical protein